MSNGSSLVNRYRQYKAGTTRVVDWLAQTARKSRDVTNILPSLRLANRAAKQAKNKTTIAEAETKIKVTTSQMLSLAQVIVDAALPVPEEILGILRVVIQARRESALWYESLRNEKSSCAKEKIDSHQYFIEVLQEVMWKLEKSQNFTQSTKPKKKHAPAKSNNLDDLANMFAMLDIEEPCSDAPGSNLTLERKQVPRVKFEWEADAASINFSIWCFLQDCKDLRQEIVDIWAEYQRGEAEFVDEYPNSAGGIHDHLIKKAGIGIIGQCGVTFVYPEKEVWGFSRSLDAAAEDEIVDLLCPRAATTLHQFLKFARNCQNNDQIPASSVFAGRFGHDEFGHYLETLLPFFWRRGQKRIPGVKTHGQLNAALQGFAISPQLPVQTWHVVALQISIDIHTLISAESVDFNAEIEMLNTRVVGDQRRLTRYLQVYEEVGKTSSTIGVLKRCIQYLQSMTTDPIMATNQGQEKNSSEPQKSTASEPFVYTGFPATAGHLMYSSALQVHTLGRRLCNTGNMVLSAAYLYRAAMLAGSGMKKWHDMEFLIETESRTTPFVREPLDGLASIYRCFGTALGMKPSAFRAGERPRLPDHIWVAKHGKKLHAQDPFCRTYGDYAAKMPTSQPKVGEIEMRTAFQTVNDLRSATGKSERLDKILEAYDRTGRMTAAQLAFALREALVKFEHKDTLDQLDFAADCGIILTTVMTLCDDIPPDMDIADAWQDNCTQPYETVYNILYEASECIRMGCSLRNSLIYHVGKCFEFGVKKDNASPPRLNRHEKNADGCDDSKITDQDDIGARNCVSKGDMMRTQMLAGLPTTRAMRIGQFCRSVEEARLRGEIAKAHFDLRFKKDPTATARLHDLVADMVQMNRGNMNAEEKGQIVALLARLIDDEDVVTEANQELSKSGLELRMIYDIMAEKDE